jgi:hypothetical protein
VAAAQDFTTFKDGQTAMACTWCRANASWWPTAARWRASTLRGIPPMVAGAARIRVTFQVDADGLLSVSPRASWARASRPRSVVKPSYGLADEQIAHAAGRLCACRGRHGRAQRCARRVSRPSAWCWPRAPRWQADGDLLERRRTGAPSTR